VGRLCEGVGEGEIILKGRYYVRERKPFHLGVKWGGSMEGRLNLLVESEES